MANNAATIPGSGDTPVVFTHTFDVAQFVAALVGQANWPERSIIVGDKKSWNDVVAIAEEIKGSYPCINFRGLLNAYAMIVSQALSSTSLTTTKRC